MKSYIKKLKSYYDDELSNLVISTKKFFEYLIENKAFKKYNEYEIEYSNPDADFNIHSLPNATKIISKMEYKLEPENEFKIGNELEKPKNNRKVTYTIKTELSDFPQLSGPVFLPWRFLLLKK